MSRQPDVGVLVERVVAIANSILQGEIDAYRGAKHLWSIQTDLMLLEGDLRLFTGLASAWEDLPDQRTECEREIVLAADRFRARWGP